MYLPGGGAAVAEDISIFAPTSTQLALTDLPTPDPAQHVPAPVATLVRQEPEFAMQTDSLSAQGGAIASANANLPSQGESQESFHAPAMWLLM